MKTRIFSRATGPILAILVLTCAADAQGITETLNGINGLFYGIVAGVAALMLVVQAIKYKTAESPQDRETAKKGMITVIFGLVLVMVAGTAVDTMYGKKTGGNGTDGDYIVKISTTTRLTTTRVTTTRSTRTTTTTTSTTTTTIPMLTAKDLASCIKGKGGFLATNGDGCHLCMNQRDNVFLKEPDGSTAYYSILKRYEPAYTAPAYSGGYWLPHWVLSGHVVAENCNTLSQLNSAFNCKLKCKPGYRYYDCSGNVIGCS